MKTTLTKLANLRHSLLLQVAKNTIGIEEALRISKETEKAYRDGNAKYQQSHRNAEILKRQSTNIQLWRANSPKTIKISFYGDLEHLMTLDVVSTSVNKAKESLRSATIDCIQDPTLLPPKIKTTNELLTYLRHRMPTRRISLRTHTRFHQTYAEFMATIRSKK